MAKRARSYICTYHYLAVQKNDLANNQANNEANEQQGADQPSEAAAAEPPNQNPTAQEQKKQLFVDIEKLTKEFQMHRCALDFDGNSLLTMTIWQCAMMFPLSP